MMLRLLALAAVCAIAFAKFDAESEISALRASMEKRIELLESKIVNGECFFCVCAKKRVCVKACV